MSGLALLLAADVILPYFIPTCPPGMAWIGQLLGAGWLGFSAFNWFNRPALLGGVYARPVVLANAVFYLVASTVLVKVAMRHSLPVTLWFVLLPFVLLASIYRMASPPRSARTRFRGSSARADERVREGERRMPRALPHRVNRP